MPLSDYHVIEAIKKTNSEDIEKRVYDKIKGDLLKLKFAGGIGAIVILLFGLFHQAVFKLVVEQGSDGLKKEIKTTVDQDLKRLDELRMKITAMTEITHRDMDTILVSVAKHHSDVVAIEDRWKNKVDDTNNLVDLLTKRAIEFAERTKVLDERIKTAQSTAETLESSYKPVIEALTRNQDEIFKNQKAATTQLKTSILPVPPIETSKKGIVYFQFAGYTKDDVEEVRKRISDAKWIVPGTENVQKNSSTEIRYNPADEAKATALKADVKDALRKLGITDLPLSKEPLVKPGILELWIAKITG
ncbi:hypothetical protein [Bradyrhizobium sp. BR 10289]|uniref:hypothetical protein n=1 Tax=Bradyrhizobium sp. BR 10289 TaxID=2749993 RepID=UPI001C65406C|nr:hypothetical protein [Bradyrhizobium sp. BR 10289]MBW7974915.1 hypothetical protein [Bradyrhizobium sp. BR 10289]